MKIMRSADGHRAKNAGFSLVEVMLVVVIIGVLAALAGPSMTSLTKQVGLETTYREAQMGFQKCRAMAITTPIASPTVPALVLFTNGYSCITWRDTVGSLNSKLGGGGAIDVGTNGVLDVGEAGGEVMSILFQTRYDSTQAINALVADLKIFMASAFSTLNPIGLDQDDNTGYLFVVAPGGYYQSPRRTSMVAKIEIQAAPSEDIRFNDPNYHPAWFCLLPSGQTIDMVNASGAC